MRRLFEYLSPAISTPEDAAAAAAAAVAAVKLENGRWMARPIRSGHFRPIGISKRFQRKKKKEVAPLPPFATSLAIPNRQSPRHWEKNIDREAMDNAKKDSCFHNGFFSPSLLVIIPLLNSEKKKWIKYK